MERYEELTELTFEVDDEEQDRATEVIDDQTIRLLKRENRIAIARGEPSLVAHDKPGRAGLDVPLIFALHAHPECTFVWARIVVNLAPTSGAVVSDIAPKDVEDMPVDIETTVGLGLKFSLVAQAVDVEANPEITRKRTVYLPRLTASGAGFHKVYWDFYAKAGDYLHVDRELRLLVDMPAGVPLDADITIRAKVRMKGLARIIPLLARAVGRDHTLRLWEAEVQDHPQ